MGLNFNIPVRTEVISVLGVISETKLVEEQKNLVFHLFGGCTRFSLICANS